MFALIAAILFIVAVFVLGTTHSYVFWMLLGLIALALHFVFDLALPVSRVHRRL